MERIIAHADIEEEIFAYIKKKYRVSPEYPQARRLYYAAFRHRDNRKQFALLADMPKKRPGLNDENTVTVLNVKISDPLFADLLLQREGFFKGYPVGRSGWLAIALDGTVPFEEICSWLEESYIATASKETKYKLRPPKEWVIPANPKYYDVQAAFEELNEIDWTQGKGIKTGDTVFIYVAAPVSAILYKCRVTKTGIPFRLDNGEVRANSIMRIKLLKRYAPDRFTFDILGKEYGIFAVRGPRGIPKSLSDALK